MDTVRRVGAVALGVLLLTLGLATLSAPAQATPPLPSDVTFTDNCDGTVVVLISGTFLRNGYDWTVTVGDQDPLEVDLDKGEQSDPIEVPGGDGEISVDFAFSPDGTWPQTHVWELPGNCVTPSEPTPPASACDAFTDVGLPEIDGVNYALDWALVNPVTYEWTVTATPEEGYEFPEGVDDEWSDTITLATNCPGPQGPPGPPGMDGEPGPTPTVEPTSTPTATASPSPGVGGAGGGADKPGLPVTGSSLPVLTASGAGLLGLGGGLLLLARKRRAEDFTAE